MDTGKRDHQYSPLTLGEYKTSLVQLWDADPASEARAFRVRALMEQLLATAAHASWADAIWREQSRAKELYRDTARGFVQMAHFHGPGHANPPHDHGPHWVVYGVARGRIEIATYRLKEHDGSVAVDECHILTPGTAYIYPVGAIHSTRQLSNEGSIVLRFLSHDLKGVARQRYPWDAILT